jgi:hypothetical protein
MYNSFQANKGHSLLNHTKHITRVCGFLTSVVMLLFMAHIPLSFKRLKIIISAFSALPQCTIFIKAVHFSVPNLIVPRLRLCDPVRQKLAHNWNADVERKMNKRVFKFWEWFGWSFATCNVTPVYMYIIILKNFIFRVQDLKDLTVSLKSCRM